MLALLVFSYACCGVGVWFGWYLRGERERRKAAQQADTARKWEALSASMNTLQVGAEFQRIADTTFINKTVGRWSHRADA